METRGKLFHSNSQKVITFIYVSPDYWQLEKKQMQIIPTSYFDRWGSQLHTKFIDQPEYSVFLSTLKGVSF